MECFAKQVNTVIILGTFAASILWINGKFNDVEKDISSLRTDIAIVKTVLILKNLMPVELSKCNEVKEEFGFVSFDDLDLEEICQL